MEGVYQVNRAERDSFTAQTPDDIAYGEGACLETPKAVFDRLNERFKFDVDLTANENNHLLPEWMGPGSMLHHDALECVWNWYGSPAFPRRMSGYSNPPYGNFIPKILTKALHERDKGFLSVFLLPLRASKWYKDLVLPYYSELWHLESRLTFPYLGKPRIDPETKLNRTRAAWNTHNPTKRQRELKPDGALFDSIVVVYRPLTVVTPLQGMLFAIPPPVRPNVWNHKTGELRY